MTYPGTWLYAPADRPAVVEKALRSGASAVIADLEDAVDAERKENARLAVLDLMERIDHIAAEVEFHVRVNGLETPYAPDDLAALGASPHLRKVDVVRLPKVESLDQVAEARRLLGSSGPGIHVLIESAAGVECLNEIVRAPGVVAVSLGEGDLAADVGISSADDAFDWFRIRVVVAAAAAGLPAPSMSPFSNLDDQPGLRRTCEHGRRLGMRGRAAIHPRQLPTIAESFAPSSDEVARARRILEEAAGHTGAQRLSDGTFIDRAVVFAARRTLRWNALMTEPSEDAS